MQVLLLLSALAVGSARAGHLHGGSSYLAGSSGAYNTYQVHTQVVPASGHSIGTSIGAPIVTDGAGLIDARAMSHFAQASPRVHEIHSHSAPRTIRVEEFRSPKQLVRVHEGGQAAPQVLRIQGPAYQQDIVRLFTRGGQARVQHVVHQAPGQQVFDVHKEPAPGGRYIHIVRSPAAAARVEVAHESAGPAPQIVLQAASSGGTVVIGPSAPSSGHYEHAFGASFSGSHGSYHGHHSSFDAGASHDASFGDFASVGGDFADGGWSAGDVHTVHTKVVPYSGGFTTGGHVKLVQKW